MEDPPKKEELPKKEEPLKPAVKSSKLEEYYEQKHKLEVQAAKLEVKIECALNYHKYMKVIDK
jgi:hypothetical protein